jgi:4-hydroxy-3-polyprenylbenzoate decarboxylase
MSQVVEMGGVIYPPVPALYTRPETLDDMVSHTTARALDLLGVEIDGMERWLG